MWKFRWSFYIDIFSFKTIHVHWADFSEFNNFGDILNKYLINKITNKNISFVKVIPIRYTTNPIVIGIGSIVNRANRFTYVWGAGLMNRKDTINNSNYLAVRGPITIRRMKELGITPPKAIGDPALLLPLYYDIVVDIKYDYGIIPHHVDFDLFKGHIIPDNIFIIDITRGVENFVSDVKSCKKIISSSLHGLIIANAYNIDCSWVKLSERLFGDDTKFYDYLESIKLYDIQKESLSIKNILEEKILNKLNYFNVDKNRLKDIQEDLLNAFEPIKKL